MRSKTRLVVLGATLLVLSGCSSVPDAVNPISWYRGITGASKNDDLGKDQNQQNLQEGSNEPYPNLGNVPQAPETALSGIDRDKLVNSLIADRNNAQYSNEDLHPGRAAVTAPPPAPPTPAAPPAAAPATPRTPPASAAVPSPPPPTVQAQAAPPSAPVASATPRGTSAQSPPPQGAPKRPPAHGSEAPPAESSLTSPKVKSVPEGEAVTPPPPPPQISPPQNIAPQNSKVAAPPPPATVPGLKAPNVPARETSAPPSTPNTATSRRPAISYRVADVAFTRGSALLSDKLRDTIAAIVKLHNDNGGMIRIVGHGEAAGSNTAVAGLTLALDRAQAVAIALTDAGVAAKDISVEAAPVAARGGSDVPRAEVYLEN